MLDNAEPFQDRDALVKALEDSTNFKQIKLLDIELIFFTGNPTGPAATEVFLDWLLQGKTSLEALRVSEADFKLGGSSCQHLKHLEVSADTFDTISKAAREMPLVETIFL